MFWCKQNKKAINYQLKSLSWLKLIHLCKLRGAQIQQDPGRVAKGICTILGIAEAMEKGRSELICLQSLQVLTETYLLFNINTNIKYFSSLGNEFEDLCYTEHSE